MASALGKKPRRSNLPGRPDFIYSKSKVAVFVHGCFWHRCPVCNLGLPKTHRGYWKRKFDRNLERDALVSDELRRMGWSFIVVWEHEVKANPYRQADRIRKLVQNRRETSLVDTERQMKLKL